ncbi:MAG TPA: zf-HC2 domain-containing protein [Marmoricola sp.]
MNGPIGDDICTSAGAYVLGALSPEERADFERHLAGCADCRHAVGELAGIPGLLARLSPADLADPPPAPDTLLPRLLAAVRRRSRRRLLAGSLAAAAAVAAAVLVTGQVIDAPTPGPPAVAMHAVAATPVSATLSVVPEAGGSRLRMRCHYAGQLSYAQPYALVVTDSSGVRHRLATWQLGPDGDATVSASVAVPPRQIASVELTTIGGQPLLRLRHPGQGQQGLAQST